MVVCNGGVVSLSSWTEGVVLLPMNEQFGFLTLFFFFLLPFGALVTTEFHWWLLCVRWPHTDEGIRIIACTNLVTKDWKGIKKMCLGKCRPYALSEPQRLI